MNLYQEIIEAVRVLSQGGTLVYPTDTIWGIGCDATNSEAVKKVYRLKRRSESKSLIILVSDLEMLKKYVPEISGQVFRFLSSQKRPTTVIYKKPVGLAGNVIAEDNTVAIRIPDNEFCQGLIRDFDRPIVSTSANYSDTPSPSCFDDIDDTLLKKADYIVNLSRHEKQNQASQIARVDEDGGIEWIRK